RCDQNLSAHAPQKVAAIQGHEDAAWRALSQLITALENRANLSVTPNATAQAKTLELRGANSDYNMITSVLTDELGSTGVGVLTVTKGDGGVWVLNPSTPNTFTGVLGVNSGQLGLTSNAIGAASSLRLANGTVFGYGADLTITRPITLGNNATSVFSGSQNITFGSVGTPITVTTEAGDNDQNFSINLDAGKVLTAYANLASGKNNTNSRTLNIRGSGSTVWIGEIRKQATSTGLATITFDLEPSASFTMAGSTQNTYDGDTNLFQGNLILSKPTALGASKRLQMNGGVLSATQAQTFTGTDASGGLIFNGDHTTFAGTSSFTFNGLTVNWGGNRQVINALTGGATLTLNNVNLTQDGTNRTLNILGAGTTNITGTIANGSTATASALRMLGSGTINLTGSSTFGVRLLVDHGNVVISGALGGVPNLSGAVGEGLRPRGAGVITLDSSGANNTVVVAQSTPSVTTTSGTNSVTTASTANLRVGQLITGTGIPAGATINEITNATTFRISANATASGTVTATALAGPGRLGDGSAVSLEGGTLNVISNAAGTTESTGTLIAYGNAAITLSGAGTNSLTFSSIDRGFYADGRSALNFGATTSLGTNNRVFISNLGNGFQPRFLVGDGKLGAYSTTNGVSEFTAFATGADLNSTLASDVVRVDGANYAADDIAIDRTLRGLMVSDTAARTLSSTGNATLTLSSGALSAAGGVTHIFSIPRLSFSVVTPPTMSTLASGNVVSIADTSRLAVGQLVTGTNIPTNSFITEIINGTSFRINNNTTVAGSGNVLTATAPGLINVASGTTLDFRSTIVSNNDLIKVGSGTLLMAARQYLGTRTAVLEGTLRMGAGDNTLWSGAGVLLSVERLGTLDLNGTTLFVNGLESLVDYSGTGLITSSTGTGTLAVSSTGDRNFYGTIAGANVNFAKLAGSSTQTLFAPQTYGGKTFVSGFRLQLTDNATLNNTSQIDIAYGLLRLENNNDLRVQTGRLNDAAPLNLRGGALQVNMINRGYASERVGVINALEGDNHLEITSGGGTFWSADLLSPALNRSSGTTVNFTGSGRLGQPVLAGRIYFDTPIATTSRGLIGAWAIANNADYAAYTPELGVGIVGDGGFVGYDAEFGAGKYTQVVVGSDATFTLPAGGASADVLKLSGGAFNGIAFAASGDVLNLGLGGLLRSNNANAARIGTVATRGVLTSGLPELIVYSNATGTATQTGAAADATVLGSTTLKLLSTAGLVPGMTISGANLPAQAYIQDVINGTDVRVSVAATGTGVGTNYTFGQSSVIIDSVIADNGVSNTVRYVKAGPGVQVLTAANTYTGGTFVNSGELNLNPSV
ncbi:MAG: hypothetical protein EBR95_06265, partial [Verrucomicrobia bacterium]|nr:hypothetical protein [Verrucomicrobiota bacterium]